MSSPLLSERGICVEVEPTPFQNNVVLRSLTMTPAETLFPNMVTFVGSLGQKAEHIFWGNTIQSRQAFLVSSSALHIQNQIEIALQAKAYCSLRGREV